jgi:hypothetical protein
MTSSSLFGVVGVAPGDAASATSGFVVDVPRETDVLLGRGHPYQNNTGNKLMLTFVAQYKEEYGSAPREKKRLVANKILDKVLEKGMRFLRRVQRTDGTGMWEEVNRNVAFEKIWHALRSKDHVPKANKIRRPNCLAPPEAEPAPPETIETLVQDILANLLQATQATNQLLRALADVIVRPTGIVTLPGLDPSAATSRDMMLREILRGRISHLQATRHPEPFLSVAGPVNQMLPAVSAQAFAANFPPARNSTALQSFGRMNSIAGFTYTATNSSFSPSAQQKAGTTDTQSDPFGGVGASFSR